MTDPKTGSSLHARPGSGFESLQPREENTSDDPTTIRLEPVAAGNSGSSPRTDVPASPSDSKNDDLTKVQTHVTQAPASHAITGMTMAKELLGTTLDHFELLDCLGIGGMGRVFLARDNRLDRLVALKVLAPEMASQPDIRRRFEQEAKAAARMDSPHFVRVHFFGADKGLQYIAMEYVDGENFRRRIERDGRLDYPDVLQIGYQLARGLEHAAESGVVHRDIKPSNIILTSKGVAKIVDMGLARDAIQGASPASEITQAGMTLGTFDYISPEQARDPRVADIRSDIYSLGCTLYHALTGRPPFPEGTALQKLLQHQEVSVPDPRSLVDDLPEPVVQVIMRMLAKNPRDRFQTPPELVHELQSACAILGVPLPDTAEMASSDWTGNSLWEQTIHWLPPMVALILGVLIYAVVSNLTQAPTPRPTPEATDQSAVAPKLLEKSQAGKADSLPTEKKSSARSPAAVASVRPINPPDSILNPGSSGVATQEGRVVTVAADADLRNAIQWAKGGDILELHGDQYSIRPNTSGLWTLGIAIEKDLTIRGKSPNGLTRVLVESSGIPPSAQVPFSLFTILGSKVRLERLLVDRPLDPTTKEVDWSAIVLEGGTLELADSVFLQEDSAEAVGTILETGRLATSGPCAIAAHRTVFAGGSAALRLQSQSSSQIELTDCVVEGFRTPFEIAEAGPVQLKLRQVTTLAGSGPVFELPSLTNTTLDVQDSIFARSGNFRDAPLVTVRTSDEFAPWRTWWQGTGNLFYGFGSQWIQLAGEPQFGGPDNLRTIGFSDIGGKEIDSTSPVPWSVPILPKELQSRLSENTPKLNPVRSLQLTPENQTLFTNGRVPGATQTPWGPLYPATPDVAKKTETQGSKAPSSPAGRSSQPLPDKTVVVNPDQADPLPAGHYRSLRKAIAETANGWTIELRTDAVLTERPISTLDRRITIRASEGYRPTLRLELTDLTPGKEVSLFSVAPLGRLDLVDVPIELVGTRNPIAEMGSLVSCAPGGEVILRRCPILIGPGFDPQDERRLAVVDVPSPLLTSFVPANEPMGAPRLDSVKVLIEDCDIRSRGSLLVSDPQGFWNLVIRNSLIATDRAAVRLAGDSLGDGDPQANRLDIDASTFLLGDGLVRMSTDGVRPDAPRAIDVVANNSAFLGTSSRPLNLSEGNHPIAFQQNAIPWEGKGNFFAGFSTYFQYGGTDAADMVMAPNSLGPKDWLRFWNLVPEDNRIGYEQLSDLRVDSPWDQSIPSQSDLLRFGLGNPPASGLPGVKADKLPRLPRPAPALATP